MDATSITFEWKPSHCFSNCRRFNTLHISTALLLFILAIWSKTVKKFAISNSFMRRIHVYASIFFCSVYMYVVYGLHYFVNMLLSFCHPYRVVGAVSNSEEFASVFNCKAGDPMNPTDKCDLWWQVTFVLWPILVITCVCHHPFCLIMSIAFMWVFILIVSKRLTWSTINLVLLSLHYSVCVLKM